MLKDPLGLLIRVAALKPKMSPALQVAAPLFSRVRALRLLPPEPGRLPISSAPLAMVFPEPLIVPPVQEITPVEMMSLVPVSVPPPERTTVVVVMGSPLLKLAVPALMVDELPTLLTVAPGLKL